MFETSYTFKTTDRLRASLNHLYFFITIYYRQITNFQDFVFFLFITGELDGLCGYAIAKYPQLNEKEWSGYEIMKMRVLSVLKNRRNSKRKRSDDE